MDNLTQTNALPDSRTCKRAAGPLTKRQRRGAHVVKMGAKRFARTYRVAGFTPVRNDRIEKAIAGTTMVLTQAALARGELFPNAAEMRAQAIRQVSRNLPSPAMVFDWRNGLPTKNNNPAYRKN